MDSAVLECSVALVRSVVARVLRATSVRTGLLNARLVLLVASDLVAAPQRNVLAHARQDDGDLQPSAALSALAYANLGTSVAAVEHHQRAHKNVLLAVIAYMEAHVRLVLMVSSKSMPDKAHANIARVENIQLRMVIRVQQSVFGVMVLNSWILCTCLDRSCIITSQRMSHWQFTYARHHRHL